MDSRSKSPYFANMSDPVTIDATGLLCPLPVLKLRKRLKTIENGELVLLLADDPAAVVDVPHFCAESGHILISTTENTNHTGYLIEKNG